MKPSTTLAFLVFGIGSLFITFLGLILLLSSNIILLTFTSIFMIVFGITAFLKIMVSSDDFVELSEGKEDGGY